MRSRKYNVARFSLVGNGDKECLLAITSDDDGHPRPKAIILCIDDDDQILGVLRDFLTTFGYTVLTARDPESTLKLFLNNHVDAVIRDYEIGEMTAEDVIVSLRTLKPGIPVVLFSGAEYFPQGLLSIVDQQLNKTEVGTLVPVLRSLLENRPRRFAIHHGREATKIADGRDTDGRDTKDGSTASILAESWTRLEEMERKLNQLRTNPESSQSDINSLTSAIRELRQIIFGTQAERQE